MKVGQVVRIAPQWCFRGEENARYRVVEDNGDRLYIELICAAGIPPQELVRPDMIVAVEEK